MWPFGKRARKPRAIVELEFGTLFFNSDYGWWDVRHELGNYEIMVHINPLPLDLCQQIRRIPHLIDKKGLECAANLNAQEPDLSPFSLHGVTVERKELYLFTLEYISPEWPDAGWNFVFNESFELVEEWMGD